MNTSPLPRITSGAPGSDSHIVTPRANCVQTQLMITFDGQEIYNDDGIMGEWLELDIVYDAQYLKRARNSRNEVFKRLKAAVRHSRSIFLNELCLDVRLKYMIQLDTAYHRLNYFSSITDLLGRFRTAVHRFERESRYKVHDHVSV